MRNEQDRPCTSLVFERFEHQLLGFWIKPSRRFVQQKHWLVARDGARERNNLPFAARKLMSARG